MKILQINAVGQSGSTGRTCKELAQYINTHTQHRCYTAFSVGEEDEYSFRIGSKMDTKLHGLLSRLTGKQAHFSKLATKRLIARMEQLRPDVVHLRNLHGNYIHFPLLMNYLAKKDIPTVVTLHDCWFFTGKCCHYTVDGCDRWQTGCHHCPRLKKDNISWFTDATKALWSEKKGLFEAIPRLAVTGVSQWITDEAGKSFLTCAKEITKIYNWIDLDIFSPKETANQLRACLVPEGNKLVLGVASEWCNAKGLDQFLALAQSLGSAYTVCLVGKMPAGVCLPENVLPIPHTGSAHSLAEFYTAADVFVTLSAEETFGKVSVEAMACGTPVVCYDSTAKKELVGQGCGAVHPLADLAAVEASVREICRQGKEPYGQACRTFAENNFQKDRQIEKYLGLYERMVQC